MLLGKQLHSSFYPGGEILQLSYSPEVWTCKQKSALGWRAVSYLAHHGHHKGMHAAFVAAGGLKQGQKQQIVHAIPHKFINYQCFSHHR